MATRCPKGCMLVITKKSIGSPLQSHPMRPQKIPSIKWNVNTMTEAQRGLSLAYTENSETMGAGRHLSLPFHPFRPISSRAKHRRGKHRSFVLIPFSKWGWCCYKLGSKQQAPREQCFILYHSEAPVGAEPHPVEGTQVRSCHNIERCLASNCSHV